MGLDAVEFAMELEDHFGLRLRDDVFSHARTVGEMAALIAAGLPIAQGSCMSARSFYRLRAWFEGAGGMPTRSVRPSTRLVDVLPSGSRRRAAWAAMQREVEKPLIGEPPGFELYKVPRLTWSKRSLRLRRVVTGVVVVWAMSTAVMFAFAPSGSVSVQSSYLMVIAIVGYVVLDARLRDEFAEGLESVGDLARRVLPEGGPPSTRWRSYDDEVLDAVRQIAARQFVVPLERVTAQTRFVEDLGMG